MAVGTPEEVAEVKESYTGQFLRRTLPGKEKKRGGGMTATNQAQNERLLARSNQ